MIKLARQHAETGTEIQKSDVAESVPDCEAAEDQLGNQEPARASEGVRSADEHLAVRLPEPVDGVPQNICPRPDRQPGLEDLAILAAITDQVRVVLSADYATHLPRVQAALVDTLSDPPTNASFEVTDLGHFDLIATSHLESQLSGLDAVTGDGRAARVPVAPVAPVAPVPEARRRRH
jgi:hypothetical protein